MTERDAFIAAYDVPRGTVAKFDLYAAMLIDWQTRMNLVGPSTIDRVWHRHFADSAQLIHQALPAQARSWIDIGAGAGFPGIVVALLGGGQLTLVDSVAKKCRFLEAVISALGLATQVDVRQVRAEALRGRQFDVISARACAPLTRLFGWSVHLAGPETQWLLLKGETAAAEVETARQDFSFNVELRPSQTDSRGHIVCARHVRRRTLRG